MQRMKLHGMASAFRESLPSTFAESMMPDNFVSWLLSNEWDYRVNATIERLIRQAGFRYKAFPEDIDYTLGRNLDRTQMERLATVDFVRNGQNLFLTGSSARVRVSLQQPWDIKHVVQALRQCMQAPQNLWGI